MFQKTKEIQVMSKVCNILLCKYIYIYIYIYIYSVILTDTKTACKATHSYNATFITHNTILMSTEIDQVIVYNMITYNCSLMQLLFSALHLEKDLLH